MLVKRLLFLKNVMIASSSLFIAKKYNCLKILNRRVQMSQLYFILGFELMYSFELLRRKKKLDANRNRIASHCRNSRSYV